MLHVAAHVRTGASWKFSEAPQETLSKEQPRGAEGVKRPLSIQNIYVCFLSFHQHCKSRLGALQNVH